MNTEKELSIITVNYKTPQLLEECLSSIQKTINGISYEIIIIDNASGDDETMKIIAKKFPNINLIISKKNEGYAKAVNKGIKISKGNFVLVVNPDVVVLNDDLGKMMKYMEQNPKVGMLGPKLMNDFKGGVQDSCRRYPTVMTPFYRRTPLGRLPWAQKALDDYLMADFNHKSVREVDWLVGSAIMIRRETLDEVGSMDERFFLYFEDVDWCRQVWKKDWKVIYFPQAVMVHYHKRSSAQRGFNRTKIYHIISGIKYFLKYS